MGEEFTLTTWNASPKNNGCVLREPMNIHLGVHPVLSV
jgi:hypothetical protein